MNSTDSIIAITAINRTHSMDKLYGGHQDKARLSQNPLDMSFPLLFCALTLICGFGVFLKKIHTYFTLLFFKREGI